MIIRIMIRIAFVFTPFTELYLNRGVFEAKFLSSHLERYEKKRKFKSDF